jgi:predicted RNase H-like HicB family nuclease
MATPVYLEVGSKKTFACSLDWPGWCRSGKTEEAALEALAAYADRYRPVAEEAGVRFPKPDFKVVERVKGNPTTDFGAPGVPADADGQPLAKAQAERLATLVAAAWTVFEQVAAGAPAELRKGPRGGGRDRDKMIAHVLDAESAYFGKVGVKDGGRDAFLDALRAARQPQPELKTKSWPWRYTARRVAWHALDHAWEMQDRSD